MGHYWESNNNCDNLGQQHSKLIYVLGLMESIDWGIDPVETLGLTILHIKLFG